MRGIVIALLGLALLATSCVNYVPASVSSAGLEADALTNRWSLSADGRFGVFTSTATNLGVNPAGVRQVWRRDVLAGVTALVSAAACGAAPCAGGDGASRRPAISADGRFVVFESDATDLTAAGNSSGFIGVYLVDTQTGSTVALSAEGGDSNAPSISANGLKVAFSSENPSLVAGDTNGASDVFLYTVFPAGIERVSVGAGGLEADAASSQALVSGDGNVVAFYSEATNLGDSAGDSFYRRVGGVTAAFFADPPHAADLRIDSVLRVSDHAGERFGLERSIDRFQCPFFGCFFYLGRSALYIDSTGAPLLDAAGPNPGEGPRGVGLPEIFPVPPNVYPQISADGSRATFIAAPNFEVDLYGADLDGSAGYLLPDQVAEPGDVAMSSDGFVLVVEDGPGDQIDPVGPWNARLAFAPEVLTVLADGPVVPGATVGVTVTGAHFDDSLLLLSTTGGFLSNVVVIDDTTATATLTISSTVAPGSYNVGALINRFGLQGQGVCEDCLIVE